eukprot:TRINITY_DN13942_c0_g1_i4.p1 TRINITY_DN13942_c0_g1~~TRINITY_DN13942_c0_g1_i4.p1  ORF type:complete len:390 (-),score=140.05 TRINITY_DN13942_c0_g1_i4:62-1231(-)
MVSDSDDTLAALEMQKAIDISQSCLGEPDDDLAQELERCRQQLEQSLREQAGLRKQMQTDQASLGMYKQKCESMKEARQKLEEKSNSKIDELQRELDGYRAELQARESERATFEIIEEDDERDTTPASTRSMDLGKTQQLNMAMIGAESLLIQLQDTQKKLEQQEAQNQALQLRLADAKEDAAAALGEIERLTEAEEARKKELEWHEQRAPDLAAASEGFLLLQERHNALAGQVDARIAEAKENGQRAEALERLNDIKEQTIAQLTTERQQACANLSGKIKELELEVDKIPELEMLVDQYRLEVSELQCALEEQKRAQEKLPPSSPTRVFVMGDGGCEGEIRDDKAWGTGQDKDRALASLKLSLIHISEPTRLLSISYAVFCLKKKKRQ